MLPVKAYDAQMKMKPIIAARPFAFKKMFLLDIRIYQGWCYQWKRRSQEQQWYQPLPNDHFGVLHFRSLFYLNECLKEWWNNPTE